MIIACMRNSQLEIPTEDISSGHLRSPHPLLRENETPAILGSATNLCIQHNMLTNIMSRPSCRSWAVVA